MSDVPVINLSKAPDEWAAWDQPAWKIYLWSVWAAIVPRHSCAGASAAEELGDRVLLTHRDGTREERPATIGCRIPMGGSQRSYPAP